MINWLMEQSLITATLVAILIVAKPLVLKWCSAMSYYLLWLLLPLQLLMSGVMPRVEVSAHSAMQQFVVLAKQQSVSLSQSVVNVETPLLAIWLGGIVLMALLFSWFHYNSLAGTNLVPAEADWQRSVGADGPQLYFSAHIHAPCVSGLARPRIILPFGFKQLDSQTRQLILEHELTHLRRGDLHWNLLATVIALVFWFNPVVWWGLREFRQAQEMACDASVLKNKNKSIRITYARAFLEHSFSHQRPGLTTLNYGGRNNMKERIQNIKAATYKPLRSLPLAIALIAGSATFHAISGDNSKQAEESVYPKYRAEPLYPEYASKRNLEGSVVLEFDINLDGSVSNVKVVNSDMEGLFDASAMHAVSQWQYTQPNQKMQDVLVQIDFKLGPDKPQQQDVEVIRAKSD